MTPTRSHSAHARTLCNRACGRKKHSLARKIKRVAIKVPKVRTADIVQYPMVFSGAS